MRFLPRLSCAQKSSNCLRRLGSLSSPSSNRFTAKDIVLPSRPMYFVASVLPILPTSRPKYPASARNVQDGTLLTRVNKVLVRIVESPEVDIPHCTSTTAPHRPT